MKDGLAPGGVEGADRRSGVGRFLRRSSLDELPQLFNVLRGDMSLIGPRPERPEYAAQFDSSVYRYVDRQRVKSGITGWAQVHGLRGQTSIADRAEWDNYYIENFSLWLDVKILLLTVAAVFRLTVRLATPRVSPARRSAVTTRPSDTMGPDLRPGGRMSLTSGAELEGGSIGCSSDSQNGLARWSS